MTCSPSPLPADPNRLSVGDAVALLAGYGVMALQVVTLGAVIFG